MTVKNEISASEIWQKDKDHFIHPYTDFDTFEKEGSHIISKAHGAYIVDSDGHTILDGIGGLWCVNVGHGRQEMADSIACLLYTSPSPRDKRQSRMPSSA